MNIFNSSLFVSALLISFTLFLGCKNDDESSSNDPDYSACCGTEPLIASLDTGAIYVPNIFTPNSDGINDLFYVLAGSGIAQVVSLEIKDDDGNVVFESLNHQANEPALGWDGIDMNNTVRRGNFSYQLTVESVLGDQQTFTGFVCAFACDDEGFPDENVTDCNFAVQHNGEGELDENLPSFEDDCF